MFETVAYCGLSCATCPIHAATMQEDSEEQARMRAGIVRLCRERYGINYTLEDITDCDGCRTEGGRLFASSRSCSIRKCAGERKLDTCAYCPEYPCGALDAIFKTEPEARTRLDAIKSRNR